MEEFLVSLDKSTLYIIGFAIIAITILLIIKKVIMFAMMSAILALLVFVAVPVSEGLKDTVRFDTETKSVVLMVEGEELSMDVDSLKSFAVEDGKIKFTLANGNNREVALPNYAVKLVTMQLEKQGVQIKQ